MPVLPEHPGVYLWVVDGEPIYVGQTTGPLRDRLGPAGYSRIHLANTLARQPGRRNGGQETNCRIYAEANAALGAGSRIEIWVQVTAPDSARQVETGWMRAHGRPRWNRAG